MQITTQVFPFFEIPNWAVRLVVLLLILGFPVALILAWPFELTPEGIKRTEDVAPHESRPCFSGATIGYITQSLQPTAQLREETRQAAETALTLQPNLGEARALKSPSSKRGRF